MSDGLPAQPVPLSLLQHVLSVPRLDKYRTSVTEPARVVMGRYRWNLSLCMGLYPGLHYLEVAFRNRLHDALKAHFKTGTWFDMPWVLVREAQKVFEAKAELQKRHAPLEPDRIVAELSFGFWTSLLSGAYDQVIWNQRALIRQALPYMPNPLRTGFSL